MAEIYGQIYVYDSKSLSESAPYLITITMLHHHVNSYNSAFYPGIICVPPVIYITLVDLEQTLNIKPNISS